MKSYVASVPNEDFSSVMLIRLTEKIIDIVLLRLEASEICMEIQRMEYCI